MNETVNCPVCGIAGCSKAPPTKDSLWTRFYNCKRCGGFVLQDELNDGKLKDLSNRQRSILSHRLRRMQRSKAPPPEILGSLLPKADDPLPSPAEQADSLILWIGDHQDSPAEALNVSLPDVSAYIGAAIAGSNQGSALMWLLQQDPVNHLLEGKRGIVQLTMAGWQRYEALKRAEPESRRAFMAMKFGNTELDGVVNKHFKPAVARAGFEFRDMTDGQPAGLIDDQMRVALRTSRFVIADLTDENNGAYWEAGFAEGLGRPVIYTCRKKEWDEGKAHFDTSHLNTIVWDPGNLEDAATRLTATIRATLPAEAKMTYQ
jgi:hypothetical protein